MDILTEQTQISKIRPNLWQAGDGAVIGFGAILAPGGLYYCFTCNVADCQHSKTIASRWESGEDSVEDDIPFDAKEAAWRDAAETEWNVIKAEYEELADDYAIEEPTL